MKINIEKPQGYCDYELYLNGEYITDEMWEKMGTDNRRKAIEDTLSRNVDFEILKSYDGEEK